MIDPAAKAGELVIRLRLAEDDAHRVAILTHALQAACQPEPKIRRPSTEAVDSANLIMTCSGGRNEYAEIIQDAIDAAVLKERKRCWEIVHSVRMGEADDDFRCIESRIEHPEAE